MTQLDDTTHQWQHHHRHPNRFSFHRQRRQTRRKQLVRETFISFWRVSLQPLNQFVFLAALHHPLHHLLLLRLDSSTSVPIKTEPNAKTDWISAEEILDANVLLLLKCVDALRKKIELINQKSDCRVHQV